MTATPGALGTTQKSAVNISHFVALDSWRGVAAMLVLVGHICWIHPLFYAELVRQSYLMVDFFFVLSGFVIALNYSGRLSSLGDIRKFVWLRFWRLYPLHATMLLVFLAIEIAKFVALQYFNLHSNDAPFSTNNLYSFVLNAFLLQSFNLTNQATFNHSSWSISAEFYTYLVFAIVFLSVRHTRSRICLSFVVILFFGWVLLTNSGPSLNVSYDLGFVRCVMEFFVGILVFYFWKCIRDVPTKLAAPVASVAQFGSILLFVVLVVGEGDNSPDIFIIFPITLAVLSFAVGNTSKFSRMLSIAPLRWLGARSYSIYMTHEAVLWGYNQILRVILGVPDVQGWYRDDQAILATSLLTGTIFMVMAIGTTLVVSEFTYKYVEKPWRNWSRGRSLSLGYPFSRILTGRRDSEPS